MPDKGDSKEVGMSEGITAVTDTNFAKEVLKSNVPVLVDFTAEWCPPCKMIAPIIGELAQEYEGKIKVVKMDVDDNGQTATKLGVMNIPTIMFFKEGKEYKRMVGANPKKVYENVVKEIMGA